MSAHLISYEEEYDYSDELKEEFNQLCLAQERVNNITRYANLATCVNGVASFDDDEENSSGVDWETIGACFDYDGIRKSGADLDKLLRSIPHHKAVHRYGDSDTISTCSTSDGSVTTSSSRGTIFVSTSNELTNKTKSGSTSVKTKLRAIASIIDPKLGQKIQNRRGFWSGVHVQYTNEGGVETVLKTD